MTITSYCTCASPFDQVNPGLCSFCQDREHPFWCDRHEEIHEDTRGGCQYQDPVCVHCGSGWHTDNYCDREKASA